MSSAIELVFIIDCSKAMAGKEFEIVSGINATLDGYRSRSRTVYVNTFTFNGRPRMMHDRLKIDSVKPLTIADVKTGGDRALYDTIATVIKHIRNIHHYIRTEDIPGETLVFIYSGGLENASEKYGRNAVKDMISNREKQYRWKFIFEGENIYAAKKSFEINRNKQQKTRNTIDDEDFRRIMKILKNGKFNW